MESVHVAVGVVEDAEGRILIALRPDHAHQGGLWEFPGGKVAEGETLSQALRRELHEELGIIVEQSTPLIKIPHDYGDKSVLLDVHRVMAFSGIATGREGQPIRWVLPEALSEYQFPAANRPIVTALTLPDTLLITGPADSDEQFIERLQHALSEGVKLIQLRYPDLAPEKYAVLAEQAEALCSAHGARLQLNTSVDLYRGMTTSAGLHLNRWQLLACLERPVPHNILLGTSCHNATEIHHARQIDVDYICLSPVAATASHPDVEPLGWNGFAELVRNAGVPVYALGGMRREDIACARLAGGQGIAGISFVWR